jgi:hypothetical protein
MGSTEGGELRYVLLTDIAGSQPLAEGYTKSYQDAEAQHDTIVGEVIAAHEGEEDLRNTHVPQLGGGPLADFTPRTIPVSPGRIAPGLPADLTLLDLGAQWTVDPAQFKSKSRNTPFAGWEAQGRAVLTLCGGKVTHDARGLAG